MDDMQTLGPVLGIGMVVLMALIIVPLVLRSTRKAQAQARQYNQGPTRLGFHQNGPRFEGMWQGFPAWVQPHFEFNYMGVAWNALLNSKFGGPNTFFHRYEFGMRVPGANFPPTSFYERDWWGMFSNVEIQRRAPVGNKQPTGTAIDSAIDVHAVDPRFAHFVAASPELQQAMASWPYLNLQIAGDTISLELIHHWRNLEDKLGKESLMSWQFAERAFSMMAAAARAASNVR